MKTIKDIDYSFKHTKQRLKERYGIDISRTDYNLLCGRVKRKEDVRWISTEYQKNDTQHVYDLSFPFRNDIRVVWSKKRDCITTALNKRRNM